MSSARIHRPLAAIAPVVVLAMILMVAVGRGEATPGGGDTQTSVSLLSVSANGTEVDLGTGLGMSDNEPGSMRAVTDFFAARALDLNIGQVTATADADNPEGSSEDQFLPIDVDQLVSATVTLAGAEAQVDPANYYAQAALGHATVDGSVMNGLVEMTGVQIGFSNESTTSTSQALEGISIEEMTLVPLGTFLDRTSNMSADDLIAFAESIGGQPVIDALAAVELARQSAITTINGLLPLGVPALPSTLSAQGLIDYAAACASDPLLAPVCGAITAAVAPVSTAVDLLETTVGDTPLISISALQLGVSADTADGFATSTAIASWGSAMVAGIELMDIVDPDAAIALLIATVEDVEAALRALPGLEGLQIDITPLTTTTTFDPNGYYATASSSLDFLEISMSAPASQTVPQPMSVTIDVITMSAASQHRGATVSDGVSPSPSTSPTIDGSPDPSPSPTNGTNGSGSSPSPSPSNDPDVTEVQGGGFDRLNGGSNSSGSSGNGGGSSSSSGSGGSGGGSASGCVGGCMRLANTGFDARWIAVGTLLIALGSLMLTWLRREPVTID